MAWKTRIINSRIADFILNVLSIPICIFLILIGYEGDEDTEENGFYPYYFEGVNEE